MSCKIRNLTAFWIFGFCSLYTYQIILSAAHDLLNNKFVIRPTNATNNTITETNASDTFQCNDLSTGTILLADILPALVLKLILPYWHIHSHFGVSLIAIILTASLILVGFTSAIWMTFLAVGGVSVATGLSEIMFLRISSISYGKNEMVSWAAGTGAAAIVSATAYAAFTTAGISIRNTLLFMLVIPILMILGYCFLLVHPNKLPKVEKKKIHDLKEVQTTTNSPNYNSIKSDCNGTEINKMKHKPSCFEKLKKIKSLMKYALPLTIVYMAENFINLGLYELIYFPGIWLSHSEQYRWFLTDYQMGVFISRSLGMLFTWKKTWILPILQVVNVALFLLQVIYAFIPSVWIVFALILYEGLLGGATYVNIFGLMIDQVDEADKEFAMSFVTVGDALGIALAGALALPVHDFICQQLHM